MSFGQNLRHAIATAEGDAKRYRRKAKTTSSTDEARRLIASAERLERSAAQKTALLRQTENRLLRRSS